MKITIERIVILILAGWMAFSTFQTCNKNSQLDKLADENLELRLKNQKLDSIKNLLDQTVTIQQVIETQNQAEIRKLSDEKFQLQQNLNKKIKEVLYYQSQYTKIQIDSILVPYEDTTKIREFKTLAAFKKFAEDSMIVVPKPVKLDTTSTYYKNGLRFTGEVRKTGFQINNIGFIDSQYVRLVEKKRSFWQFITFQRRPIEAQVLHTSPYITVTGQNSVIYRPKSGGRILEKAVLIGAGIFLGTKL